MNEKTRDEAIAELLDDCVELRQKVQEEPWTDVEAAIEDMTRRFLDKVWTEDE